MHGAPTKLDQYEPFPCETDQGLTYEIKKKDCLPGTRFMERLCCFVTWRDQAIVINDTSRMEEVVRRALDGTYQPRCEEGDTIVKEWRMFSCS